MRIWALASFIDEIKIKLIKYYTAKDHGHFLSLCLMKISSELLVKYGIQ